MILESSVGRSGVCAWGGAGQGAATRNSYSIPRSCKAYRSMLTLLAYLHVGDAATCRSRCAIRHVASFIQLMNYGAHKKINICMALYMPVGGQLRNLG